jgi:CBS domain-containing protein
MRHLFQIIENQNPLMLRPSATVKQACRHMRDRRVGAVLVTDEKAGLVGIFTARDAVWRVLAEAKDPATTTLDQVMTRDPRTLSPNETAIDALRLLRDGGHRHLPVVDKGKVVGVISNVDFRGLELDRLDEEIGLWERI